MLKFIKITLLTIFFISCSNDVEKKSSIAFSDKDYSEAFQLIEKLLNSPYLKKLYYFFSQHH